MWMKFEEAMGVAARTRRLFDPQWATDSLLSDGGGLAIGSETLPTEGIGYIVQVLRRLQHTEKFRGKKIVHNFVVSRDVVAVGSGGGLSWESIARLSSAMNFLSDAERQGKCTLYVLNSKEHSTRDVIPVAVDMLRENELFCADSLEVCVVFSFSILFDEGILGSGISRHVRVCQETSLR